MIVCIGCGGILYSVCFVPCHTFQDVWLRTGRNFIRSPVIFNLFVDQSKFILETIWLLQYIKFSLSSTEHVALTNCCNFLNSFGFVPAGTNCNGLSIRTAFECVGEPSATHYWCHNCFSIRPIVIFKPILSAKSTHAFDRIVLWVRENAEPIWHRWWLFFFLCVVCMKQCHSSECSE